MESASEIKFGLGLRVMELRQENLRRMGRFADRFFRLTRRAIRFWRLRHCCRVHDCGEGNSIQIEGRHPRTLIHVIGSNNRIRLGAGSRLAKTEICIVGNGCEVSIDARLTETYVHIKADAASLLVGRGTTFKGLLAVTEDRAKLTLGKNCMMGGGVAIRCGDGHPIYEGNVRLNLAEYVEIGDDVWGCEGVLVLKNVKVGDGAILAARSVVASDVAAQTMVAGIPARCVKTDIRWKR